MIWHLWSSRAICLSEKVVNGILLAIGEIAEVGLFAAFFLTGILGYERFGSRFGVSKPTADAMKYVCFCFLLPLSAILFLYAPHGWGPTDYRNSAGFRQEWLIGSGIVEVLVIVATVRVIRRLHRR